MAIVRYVMDCVPNIGYYMGYIATVVIDVI